MYELDCSFSEATPHVTLLLVGLRSSITTTFAPENEHGRLHLCRTPYDRLAVENHFLSSSELFSPPSPPWNGSKALALQSKLGRGAVGFI